MSDIESPPVLYGVGDGVATITLNRPGRHNAFDDAMDAAMWDALEAARDDDAVRAIVLRGAGKSFSSGRDLSQLGLRPEGVSDHDYIAAGHARTRLLFTLDKPIIAALTGWAIGGSFERALLCDLRVAGEGARMRLPEVAHGVLCDSGGTARLVQIAGHGLASDLVLTGRVLGAAEALTHGLVSRVVPDADVHRVADEMARDIASRDSLAVRLSLGTIRSVASPAVEASLDRELLAQTTLMASPAYLARKASRQS